MITEPHGAVNNVSDCRYMSDLQIQGSRVQSRPGPVLSEIDHEIISMAIFLPSPDARRIFVSYKQKYVHQLLVNL